MSDQSVKPERPAVWAWLVPLLALLFTVFLAMLSLVWWSAVNVSDLKNVQLGLATVQAQMASFKLQDDATRGLDLKAAEDQRVADLKALSEQIGDFRHQVDAQRAADETDRRRLNDLVNEMNGRLIRFDDQIGFLGKAHPEKFR